MQVVGQDNSFMAESIFRVFDDDDSGTMDFSEYVMAINAARCGSNVLGLIDSFVQDELS